MAIRSFRAGRPLVVLGTALGVLGATAALAQSTEGDFRKAETRSVTDAEMKQYLGALKEVVAYTEEVGKKTDLGEDPEALFRGGYDEGKIDAIIGRHGLDKHEFVVIHSSVWQAYMANAMKGNEPALQAMMGDASTLEQMKAYMSPEDYERVKQQMAEAQAQSKRMQEDVPPGNRELVARYQTQLEAIVGSTSRMERRRP